MTQAGLASRRAPRPSRAGGLLRGWRELRGRSQLELSLDAGVSQKHVSFVETGRSTPSRQMIVDLADALQVPLRERNMILVAAGYAPVYRDEPLDAAAMQGVRRAVDRMLRQHEPYPALAMDRHWNVIATNDGAPAFFGSLIDLGQWPKPRNLLRLLFDPAGLRPFLTRWDETAQSLLARVRREATGGVLDEDARALLGELMRYPDAPTTSPAVDEQEPLPIIPLEFRVGSGTIALFSMVATVGTPRTVVAEEIRLETMFPTDEAMERAYLDGARRNWRANP